MGLPNRYSPKRVLLVYAQVANQKTCEYSARLLADERRLRYSRGSARCFGNHAAAKVLGPWGEKEDWE